MKLVRKILVAMLLGTMAFQAVWADINYGFLEAASRCNLDKVKQLLRLGADVNADNGKALVYVSDPKIMGEEEKCFEVGKYLVSQGLDINAEYSDKNTEVDGTVGYKALLNTTRKNPKLAKYLISKGVDVNTNNHKYGYNMVLRKIIFKGGNLDLIEYAISKGAVVSPDDLNRVFGIFEVEIRDKKMSSKEWAVVKLAIKNTKNLDSCKESRHSIMPKDNGVGDLLLQNGLNINHQCESSGYTRLMEAYDDLKLVKYLISKGADVNIKDNKGETALTKALSNGYYDTAEFLISKGAKK